MSKFIKCAAVILSIQFVTSLQNPIPRNIQNLEQKYGLALEAIISIGIRLQVLLEDPGVDYTKNFLVSPLSVTLLISQLMIGADDNFRAELYNLLSLPNNNNDHKLAIINYYGNYENKTFTVPYAKLHSQMGNLLRELEKNSLFRSFTLNCTTALFFNKQLNLLDSFVHNLHIYETEIWPVNFSTDPLGTENFINNWAAEQTNGVIKTVLPSALPRTTAAIFTNAIYFKADWETPFSYELNMNGSFHTSLRKTVEVEYMQRIFDSLPYADSPKLGCRIVKLPYKDDEVAMYFILPYAQDGKEYNINKFTEGLRAKDVLYLFSQLKNSKVALLLPKFKLLSSLSILDPLQRYRAFKKLYRNQITSEQSLDPLDAVQKRIDMFNALKTTDKLEIELGEAALNQILKVSNIFQQVSLAVDEKGTEAAAVSASVIDYIGGTKSFRLDRPFAFTIRHEPTLATLFWGTVSDPTLH